jgi:hypothetical protein
VHRNWVFKDRRIGAALALAGMVAAAACTTERSSNPEVLPRVLHGLARMDTRSGTEAAQVIKHEHPGAVVPPENYVAAYGPTEMRATIYVSRYGSPDSAKSQAAAVAQRLANGGAGFGHYSEFSVKGKAVHSVFGPGAVNYFYVGDRDLIWLTVPPMLARPGLAELLDVPVDSIPPLMVPRQP